MKLQSFIMFILWSSSANKVLPFKLSSINPSVLNSIQSLYYLEADTNSNHVEPKEDLKRTQRSFLKKFWKDIGLQNPFNDEGCVNCCNNNYNAGEGDIYEKPPTSSDIPSFQQLPPLHSLQPFDPLRIFQPFLRSIDFNTNGFNGAGYINNENKCNTPKIYEGENSDVINNNYEMGTSEVTECNNIERHKAKEDTDYSFDINKNNGPICSNENGKIYKNSSVKNTYQMIDTPPVKNTDVYTAPPFQNSQQNVYQTNVYTNEKKKIPSYDNLKDEPDTKVINSNQSSPCGISPHSALLSNKIPPSEEYLNLCSHKNFASPPLLPSLSSRYGVGSQCSCTEVTPSDIAIYAIMTQNSCTFAPSIKPHSFNVNPYYYGNNIHDLYKGPAPPITLTEADQPYRSCPELFTDYLNHGNYKKKYAKGKTFVNAPFISC